MISDPGAARPWLRLSFVLGSDISSRLIAWYGQGYDGYSHVDALLSDGTRLGARSDEIKLKSGAILPPGVQVRPENYEKWRRRCDVLIPSTQAQAQHWETWLRSQVGEGYDQTDIVGLIIGKPLMSAGHWICSALQTKALETVGRLPTLPQIPQQVPPNMLLAVAVAIGGTFIPRV